MSRFFCGPAWKEGRRKSSEPFSEGAVSIMHAVMILSIIFGGIVLALAIIGSTILAAVKILKGGATPKGQKLQAEEARVVQEIYHGLSRMEQRIEALETLILDRERKDPQP